MDLDGTNDKIWTNTIRGRNRPLYLATHLTSSYESFVEEAVASCKVPASQRRVKWSGGSIHIMSAFPQFVEIAVGDGNWRPFVRPVLILPMIQPLSLLFVFPFPSPKSGRCGWVPAFARILPRN